MAFDLTKQLLIQNDKEHNCWWISRINERPWKWTADSCQELKSNFMKLFHLCEATNLLWPKLFSYKNMAKFAWPTDVNFESLRNCKVWPCALQTNPNHKYIRNLAWVAFNRKNEIWLPSQPPRLSSKPAWSTSSFMHVDSSCHVMRPASLESATLQISQAAFLKN